MQRINLNNFEQFSSSLKKNILPDVPMVMVGMGTCGIGNGADVLYESLQKHAAQRKYNCIIKPTGCFGFCAEEPLVTLYQPGKPLLVYARVNVKDVIKILDGGMSGKIYGQKVLCRIENWDFITSQVQYGTGYEKYPLWNEIPFFKGQKKIVLRNAGLINPESIEDYLAVGGYRALFKVLSGMTPDDIIAEVKNSGMRGRGGAGFPTGVKWELMKKNDSAKKYLICNADEGDPGAYMNRNEIESDPHSIIEGMMIAAYAMGADEGIAYIRAEYPLAVERLEKAQKQAEALGLIGDRILGTNFKFKFDFVEGAGAFVCGEETALIASIEGKAGRPVPRPPYPAAKGLYGYPTNINNVETWCNIPVIIDRGAQWFRETGTEKSPGTKVFSLVGKIKNTGLVEMPMGSTINQFVFDIGEGTGSTVKRVKAIQTGGPSGGCIPLELFNTAVDYESLAKIGAIMGSGGMVVMDHDNCMVDVARYFLEFNASESCGKCTPCREGLTQALKILTKITRGQGTDADLNMLEVLSQTIKDTAICGLGQTAPNPILTTLKYFRHEYEEHIHEKRCYAGVCEDLFLALCENSCPLHMNIPAYIELIKENRIEDAFEVTLRDNPLPGTIGRICHFHCQMRCRREMLDEPVSQGEIHRYLADTMYQLGKENVIYRQLIKEKLPATGKKIAIVGAGPAGLTAAFYLVRLGHEVVIYDSFPEPGGLLRYGIPRYRLPNAVLKKEVDLIRKLGVEFKQNTTIGKDISLKQLEAKYDAIYVAIGAWKEMGLNIPGEDAKGVYSGTELLKSFALGNEPPAAWKIVVVGGGNVAIDVARSLWRYRKDITVVYRREKCDMPANDAEIREAEAEGIKFHFMSAPAEVMVDADNQVKGLKVELMTCGGIDTSGRRKPVKTGKFDEIPCEAIVLAIGETVDSDSWKAEGLKIASWGGRIKINPLTQQTAKAKIYAGGDAVTGPSTAAEAMGMAKKAVEAIDFDLMQEKRYHLLYKTFDYRNVVPEDLKKSPKNVSYKLDVRDRVGSFVEVDCGYTGQQALNEVSRCLRCDVRCDE